MIPDDRTYYDVELRKLTDSEVAEHLAGWRFSGATPWLTTDFADGEFTFAIFREHSNESRSVQLVIVGNVAGENRWDGKGWRGAHFPSALHHYYSPKLTRAQAVESAESIIKTYWDKRVIGRIEPKTRTNLTLDNLNAKWAYFVHCITDEHFRF